MGYYVELTESTVLIPTENLDDAYEAVCELNAHDELKSGGCWGSTPTPKPADSKSVAKNPDKWFAWMGWNYDETCQNLKEVLEELGFDVDETEEGLRPIWYDNKTGAEDIFFDALAPYIADGGIMEWRGEDGAIWRWQFQDGKMFDQSAVIVWG